jgi:hypothetical protein
MLGIKDLAILPFTRVRKATLDKCAQRS